MTAGDGHAMLVVHDAEKTDNGSYTISVENELSKDYTTFNIAITGELSYLAAFFIRCFHALLSCGQFII